MKTKKNDILLQDLKNLAKTNHYIGVFNLSSCTVKEMELIRRAANAEKVRLHVVKNTILRLTIPQSANILKNNILISPSDSPAGCVGFLGGIKVKALRDKLKPLNVLHWDSGEVINHPISDLIAMKNLNGMYGRIILQLKISQIKLLHLLKSIANNPQ